MTGKASLFLVLGFSVIFFMMARNMNSVSGDMESNYYGYYYRSVAHNIAVSGANMAACQLFFDKTWIAGYTNVSFCGGTLNVRIDSVNTYNRQITSVSNYMNFKDTVIVLMSPKNFAQYGNFFSSFGSVSAATGDTFAGPFHVNDYLNVVGKPVFTGKVTTRLGLNPSTSKPVLLGGYESGVNIPLDFDTTSIRLAAYNSGKIFKDTTGAGKNTDLDITFNSNGTVSYKININNVGYTGVRTVPLTTLAPNGVIYVEKGNIYVRGTVNGQATIVASKKGTSGSGNVYITSDVKYNKDPQTDASSTDMLGMCGEQSVTLKYDATRGDIDIQASMFAQNSGFVVENYSSYPSAHAMRVYGGLIASTIGATATYNAYNQPTHGYSYVHRFDNRFLTVVPPYFPQTRYYKIISWYE